MRHAVLILIFCCSKLFSQVGPPDLRCLEVLPNGNVILTWIPPAITTGFYSYEVYSSAVPGGPYAFYGPAVTNPTVTTFLHATNTGNIQSLYYYVITKYGPGGTSSSISSDTLRTIYLNAISLTGAVDLKFLYNDVHSPKLPSTSPTFTISKEYPVGTTNVLAITPEPKYADTISVCNAVISYYVKLKDNSGCISISSKVTGTYTDTYRPGGPGGPVVDSISVLPDGTTSIAWHIPRDLDIVKYQIYYRENPNAIISPTAIVPGRSNTYYNFPYTTALTEPIALFVAAVDSCSDDPGIYNKGPITIHLNAVYDSCSYTTHLTWNKYVGLLGGILEYRIYYSDSVNGPPSLYHQIGNTKDTFFVHSGTSPGKNVCYFIRVINNPKTITASSNRVPLHATQVRTSNYIYIKTATISGKTAAQVKMYLDTSHVSRGIDVFRSDDGSSFSNVGFMPFNGTPDYVFTDQDIKSTSQSYVYKAIVRDDCGNARTVSNLARTILLKVEDDQEKIFTKHLSWNAYMGFSGSISHYNIYRVINDVIENSPIATAVPQVTAFTDDIEDEASQGARIDYLVQAVEGTGDTYGFLEVSNSNPAAVYMDGRIYVPTAFAPNGYNKKWLPVTHYVDKTEYTVMVFDRWGAKVFETNRDDVAWDGNNCIPDVYVYLIRYKNAFGEYKEIKGTVLMLE